MPFWLHRSNSIEVLIDALAEIVGEPTAEWTEPVVVGERGLRAILSAGLARRLGVWLGQDFPLPRAMIERVTHTVVGTSAASGFAPDELSWTLAARLLGLCDQPLFEEVRGFLDGDEDHRRYLELCDDLAQVYDAYLSYRPDRLASWERGQRITHWTHALWREVCGGLGRQHLATRTQQLIACLRDGQAAAPLPRRFSLFAVSQLPPLYVEALSAIAEHTDLHCFFLSPSREYWGRDAIGRQPREQMSPTEDAPGARLLRGLGVQGMGLAQYIEEHISYREIDRDLFVPPPAPGVLGQLQRAVLTLDTGGGAGGEAGAPAPAADRSFRVHACYSPLRELEVLRDVLIDRLDSDPGLEPRHIAVAVPAVEAYRPFIETVFGDGGSVPGIPFVIEEGTSGGREALIDVLVRLCAVLAGRLEASTVLDLLYVSYIREAFSIAEDELATIRGWVTESRICWGADEDHRADEGYPRAREHTWRFGVDRLLVSYALGRYPAHQQLHGVVTTASVAEGQCELLGRFSEFVEAVISFHRCFHVRRDVASWCTVMRDLVMRFFGAAHAGAERVELLAQMDKLAERARSVDLETSHAAMLAALERTWRARATTRLSEQQGIRFVSLGAGGVLDARVVCLLGMSDEEVPRRAPARSYDELWTLPRAGDPSVASADRYAVLEAVLAARDALHLSYVGCSAQHGTPIAPSVVVDELLDAVAMIVSGSAPSSGVREQWIVRHPLVAYSPRYFRAGEDPRLFSYSRSGAAGARALAQAPHSLPALDKVPTASTSPGPAQEVSLDELVAYFSHPARFYLQTAFGVNFLRTAPMIDDHGPVQVAGLEGWRYGQALLDRAITETATVIDSDEVLLWARAMGFLPPGVLGEVSHRARAREVRALVDRVRALARDARAPQHVDLRLGSARVSGVIRDRYGGDRVVWSYSRCRARHLLGQWVRHLFWCATAEAAPPGATVMVHRGSGGPFDERAFTPVAEAGAELASLVALYLEGRTQRLAFLPECSHAFAATAPGEGVEARAWKRAQAAYRGSPGIPGEGQDPYVARLFGDDSWLRSGPVRERFGVLARAIFDPIAVHQAEDTGGQS